MMKTKNLFFWIMVVVLLLLILFVVFVEYREISKQDFKGDYSYVNDRNITFNFTAEQKEGTSVVFHYVTVERRDDRKRVLDYFTVALRNSPYGVEDIVMEENVKDNMYVGRIPKKFTYIVQDPSLGADTDKGSVTAAYQLGLNIGIKGYLKTNVFLRHNREGYSENPTVNCSFVTSERAVIEYRFGEPKIYAEDGCIILQADTEESIYDVTDKFTMHLIGVF